MLKIILANALYLCQIQNGEIAPFHIVNLHPAKICVICIILCCVFMEIAIITGKLYFYGFFDINCGLGLQFSYQFIYLWILLEKESS
jgi:hypothetical protein